MLERAKFHEAYPSCKFRLVQRGAQAIHAVGFPHHGRQLKNVFRKLLNFGRARTAAGQHDACAQIIQKACAAKLLLNELKDFFETQRHDTAQMFDIYSFSGEAQFVLNSNRLPLDAVVQQSRAVLDLQFFRAAERRL